MAAVPRLKLYKPRGRGDVLIVRLEQRGRWNRLLRANACTQAFVLRNVGTIQRVCSYFRQSYFQGLNITFPAQLPSNWGKVREIKGPRNADTRGVRVTINRRRAR